MIFEISLAKLNIDKELNSILDKLYKQQKMSRTEDPLDGDDVEELVELISIEFNYMQGNMTDEEYMRNRNEI
tara:strand:- start:374 stop:589 length:216 start_codon:yes stop_codon:yes gene_type:complete